VAEVGSGRARVWRLYMAASALNFEAARTQVHQVLAVRSDGGRSGLPLRPRFEERPLQR
jgi:cyclopropane-fatty-acyl-phospholipid synthase